jgi:two-component system sensor histidine kinase CreC
MRTQLEGKAYVERYVHTLTHELKSPLAAIRGASELLQGDMPQEQRARFAGNIERESDRLQQMIERLLNLARVEQMQALEDEQQVAVAALIDELLLAQGTRIDGAGLQVRQRIPAGLRLLCDPFLMRQALANLLDNALDFTPQQGALAFELERDGERVALSLFNQGQAIPEYALGRVSERFYSLPRPGTGRKSTGLGLNFVAEVMQLHGGALAVDNVEGGVRVRLWLPARRLT